MIIFNTQEPSRKSEEEKTLQLCVYKHPHWSPIRQSFNTFFNFEKAALFASKKLALCIANQVKIKIHMLIFLKHVICAKYHRTFRRSFSFGGFHYRHVGGQNKRKFVHIVCMKMKVNSQRRKIVLFLSTNMAAMTSHANH